MRLISVEVEVLLVANSARKACSNAVGTGRERMRATSMLGLPVPAKQKSIIPMTLSLSSSRTLPRLRSPWTSFSCSVDLI